MAIRPGERLAFAPPQGPAATTTTPGRGIAPVQDIGNPTGAMGAVGDQVQRIALQQIQQERERQVRTRVMELDNQRRTADRAIVDGYLQLQGKAAVEQRAKVLNDIATNAKQLRQGVTDPDVREVWAQQDQALTNAAIGQLDAHYRQQNVRWQADTLQSRRDLLIQTVERVASGEGADPATGRLSIEAARTRSAYRDTIQQLGERLGWAPETTELELRQADTRAYGQVVENLIRDGQYQEAERVLTTYRDRIDEGVRSTLAQRATSSRAQAEGVARQALDRDTGARIADQLLTQYSKPDTTGVDVIDAAAAGEALRAAFANRSITIEQRDIAEQRIEHAAGLAEKRRAAAVNQAVANAEAQLAANPAMDPTGLPARDLAVLVQHGKLPGLISFANSGRYVNTNQAMQEIAGLQDSGELATIGDEQFRTRFWGRLDNSTFDRIDKARQALRQGQQSPEDRLDALLIEAELLHPPGTPARDIDGDKVRRAWMLKNAVYKAAQAQGVKDEAGILKLARGMIANQAFNRTGWDKRMPLEAMTPEERKTAYVETTAGTRDVVGLQALAPAELAQIDANLRASGVTQITEQARLEYYNRVAPERRAAVDFLDQASEAEVQAAMHAVTVSGGNARDPVLVRNQVERVREVRSREGRRRAATTDPLSVERFLPPAAADAVRNAPR